MAEMPLAVVHTLPTWVDVGAMVVLSVVILDAVVFWLCTTYIGFYVAVVATDLLVVALRVLSVDFDWTSSPVFPGDDTPAG
jgi:hypothetical protein